MRASRALVIAAGLGLLATLAVVQAQRSRAAGIVTLAPDATRRIVTAAQAFLATLDEPGRAKALLPADSPLKARWSNLPIGMVPRNGIRMGDLTPARRTAAMAVLEAAFSTAGYTKVVDIVRSDEVLRTSGGGAGRPAFGQDEYFLAFVGSPSVETPWIIQFGGHHLGINMTLAGTTATLAPSLTGAQPATYTIEGRTIRPLGREQDRAFDLMASLDAGQKAQAIISAQMGDLVLGPGKDGQSIQPEGLKVSAMTAAQQAIVMEIVAEWAGIADESLAAPRLEEIKAKLPQTWFAWSGPTTPGSAAYFRIQGPTLVIEYAPQRTVDHIHAIYRDPTNDYGSSYARR
jgi:hypothetical protein